MHALPVRDSQIESAPRQRARIKRPSGGAHTAPHEWQTPLRAETTPMALLARTAGMEGRAGGGEKISGGRGREEEEEEGTARGTWTRGRARHWLVRTAARRLMLHPAAVSAWRAAAPGAPKTGPTPRARAHRRCPCGRGVPQAAR